MSVIGSNILAGASGQGGGYNLTKSLRFRSSASAYLNRTGSTATNAKLATYSFWFKRGILTTGQWLFTGGTTTTLIGFNGSSDALSVLGSDTSGEGNITTAVFRDPSAWYHVVIAIDTTQTTTSDRAKIYVNGVLQAVTVSNGGIGPNSNWGFNTAGSLTIGRYSPSPSSYTDGYLAEVNFIDGLALTPSSFGETSTTTGVWIPKKFVGTYGNNGFYLKFTDTTSTSTLGTDFSGNSNTWTVNNISLTSGSTYDSMTDVPTLTSATTANYCVINPLANSGIGTLSRGNLQLVTSTNSKTITGTLALPSTGQYYWEITATDYITDNGTFLGVVNQSFLTGAPSNGTWLGFNTYSATYNNGTSTDTNGLTGANVTNDGDIWCIAVDMTNGKFWIGRSRSGSLTWADGTTPAVNGSGATTLSLPSNTLYPMAYRGGSDNETYNFNFGQQPFAHTPPTGFVALNTFNLPTPTIGATASTTANKYFDVTTITSTGTTQSITNAGGFQPDLVWTKQRNATNDNYLNDSVRGAANYLVSNTTSAEATAAQYLTSFNSNGFTLGTSNYTNGSSVVAWQWRASNATAVTNTAGSINSTVSANTTAGFSIVTWTGSGSTATIGHGLGVAPSMIIWFHRTNAGAYSHGVYHVSLPSAAYAVQLNLTNAQSNDNNWWNSTAPTSSVFTVGGYNVADTMVAYCFAQVDGYSAFGKYIGNGLADGTFVYLGFRPRFVMIKSTVETSNWFIYDTARNTYNAIDTTLFPSASNADYVDSTYAIDVLSNGFKIRGTGQYGGYNNSGNSYIYMAFAEFPFRYSLAR